MKNSSDITNVGQETWRIIKEKHKYWRYVIAAAVLWSILFFFYPLFDDTDIASYVVIAPWIFFILYYSRVVSRTRTEFWKQFAVKKDGRMLGSIAFLMNVVLSLCLGINVAERL